MNAGRPVATTSARLNDAGSLHSGAIQPVAPMSTRHDVDARMGDGVAAREALAINPRQREMTCHRALRHHPWSIPT
jgi:hypothetical protein